MTLASLSGVVLAGGALALVIAGAPGLPASGGVASAGAAPTSTTDSGTIGEVLSKLRSADRQAREEAARRLSAFRVADFMALSAEDVKVLANVLSHGDLPSRRTSAHAFSVLTHSVQGGELSRAVMPAIVAALKDPDGSVAAAAAVALGHMKDPAAVPPLLEALGDSRPGVVAAAAAAAGHLTNEQTAAQLVPSLRYEYARKPVTGVLMMLAQPPLAALTAALTSPDVDLRRGAVYALAQIGDGRVKGTLVQALGDADPQVRRSAASGLGRIRDPSVGEPLARLLDDPDPEVRRVAATAVRVGGSAVVDSLLARIKDPDPDLSLRAMRSLVAIGDSRAVEPLLEVFRQPDHRAADDLVGNLGHWKGNKEIVLGLIATLPSTDQRVRRRAARALRIDNAKVIILGREAVAPLLGPLKSTDVEVRRVAALSFRNLGASGLLGQDEMAALSEAAQDPDPHVRQWAAAALSSTESVRSPTPSR